MIVIIKKENKMKKLLKVLMVSSLIALMLPFSVFAADDVEMETVAGNVFGAGASVSVEDQDAKDVFAAGQDVAVKDSSARGNVFAAGNSVGLDGMNIGADAFIAGQSMKVEDTMIGGNLFAAGQMVSVSEDTVVGAAMIAAQNITFDGSASYLSISGESIEFNGKVDGNVELEGTSVTIGPDAEITGELKVTASSEPTVDPTASIDSYQYEELKDDEETAAETVGFFAKVVKKITSLLYWIPAMILLGLLMTLVFGKNLEEAKELAKTKTLQMVLFGAISWIAVPIVAIVCAVTIIGFPIAAVIGTVYVVLIWVGLAFAGASLSRLVFPKMNVYLTSVIGIAVLEAVRIIPVIGALVGIAADMYLIGYVVRKIYYMAFKKNAE